MPGATTPSKFASQWVVSTEEDGTYSVRRLRGRSAPHVCGRAAPVDGVDDYPIAVTAEGRVWWRNDESPVVDPVAEEVPVALVYNGVSHVVMMATPANLEDFAIGFSLSEGILESTDELYGLDVRVAETGIVVDLQIAARRFAGLKERRRNLAGRTGCGLCGVDSLDQAIRPVAPVPATRRVSIAAIRDALDALPRHQVLNGLTKSLHAAAWIDGDGRVELVREDVGRHNALDKLIGAMRLSDGVSADGFAIATSRCSYEMVQKAISAGIGVLVTISAPTALALRMAEAAGLCVVAMARADSLRVYTHADRIAGPEEAGGQQE